MSLSLGKEKGIPYYIQLKNILKDQIQSGDIKTKKLEPIRKVAKKYGVSVNTVLRAYDELGREGILSGSVGRGTFITTTPFELKKQNRKTLLRKTIEHSLEEALSLEFSIEEFEEAVREYIQEKLDAIKNVKVVFIECNIEQLAYFTEHLELDSHIKRIPILLEDLHKQDEEKLQEASSADIFITSFYHLDEVRENLEFLGKPILGINLEPEVGTIIEVAKIPPESSVGIVTTSERFRNEIKEILIKLNLNFADIYETNSKSSETIKRLVLKCNAVLVSPKRKETVMNYVKNNTRVIEFMFTPDRTSINNLKVAILELKKNLI